MKPIVYEREWVEIRGRRVRCDKLNSCLGNGFYTVRIPSAQWIQYEDGMRFVQEAVYLYGRGAEQVEPRDDAFRERHVEPPKHRHLPEAIGELFDNLEKSMKTDLSQIIEMAEQKSREEIEKRDQAQEARPVKRKSTCAIIMGLNHSGIPDDQLKPEEFTEYQKAVLAALPPGPRERIRRGCPFAVDDPVLGAPMLFNRDNVKYSESDMNKLSKKIQDIYKEMQKDPENQRKLEEYMARKEGKVL